MKNIYMGLKRSIGHFSFRFLLQSFLLLTVTCLYGVGSLAQSPTNGDYRTRATGNWDGVSTWQVRSGGTWATTSVAPTATSHIYIQNGHTLTVNVATADCNDLHINTTGTVSLGSNTLRVSGKLRAYTGTTVTSTSDGTFYSSQSSSNNPVNAMLTSSGGVLKFIGNSRVITATNEWGSALTNYATEFALTAGQTGTLQTGYKSSSILVSSGIVDMGSNRLSPDNGNTDQGSLTINAGATVMSANTGSGSGNSVFSRTTTNKSGLFTLNGTLILSGISPEIQFTTVDINPGSTIEYARPGSQNLLTSTFPGAAPINFYGNLVLSGTGTPNNKTPQPVNFTVFNDLTIGGNAVLVMGGLTAFVGGNWTNYSNIGFSESTSTIDFNGAAAQSINTAGGENFYIFKKSGAGTLTLNSNVRTDGGGTSNVNISAGILDAGTFTFDGSASTVFNMSGGTLRQAKLATVLPEFSISSYNITGGTIELNGAGAQQIRGGRTYNNLSFSNSGTKTVSPASAVTMNNPSLISIASSAILDVSNNSFGGTGTAVTMTGTSVFKTAGTGVKPDANGTYTLGTGTTIEFTNTAASLESVRLSPTYYHVIVSGTAVGTTSLGAGIKFQSGGSFTVRNAATFKLENSNGFSGTATTAIDNTNAPTIVLEPGSTIEYNGASQVITNQTINTPAAAHYERLTLSATGTKTAPAGTLTLHGDLTKTGTTVFAHNGGTVAMNGTTTQAYNSSYPVMGFYNLAINNTVDFSTNNDMAIAKELSFGAGSKLNIQSGNITLQSTATNTANVGKIPLSANISYFGNGNFTVERYIATGTGGFPNHGKTWQFLAVATNGTQTVNQAWQDTATAANQSRYAGYGTQLTSNISPLPAMFDVLTPAGPSMKTYNAATNGWDGIANTTTLPIYNQKGYMVFVRGDRTVTTSGASAVATILRTSGKILDPVSNIPPVTSVATDVFESIGNPFASAIDFSNDIGVFKSPTVQRVFYVWDPRLGGSLGYGAYQTFTKGVFPDNNYYVSPGGGSYGAGGSMHNAIESGQAFFVHTVGGAGTVSFTEDAKLSTSSLVTKQVGNQADQTAGLRTNLYAINNANAVLIDGVLNQFGQSLSNRVDELDAIKLANGAENISIARDRKELSVERRALVTKGDTIFFKLGRLKAQSYEFEFIAIGLAHPGLEAFLEDAYLHTQTHVKLDSKTAVRFTISTEAGSNAADRFRIVFRQKGKPVPPVKADQPIYSIKVYPNPVINRTMQLSFEGQTAGKYNVQLNNQGGQLVMERTITVNQGRFATSIKIPAVAPGNYQLVISAADGSRTTQQVIIQ